MTILFRVTAIALVACACAGGAAGANGATSIAKLKVAFAPDRKGVRTTIELALKISGPGGTPPEPITSFDLFLPAGMGIASTTLGQSNCYTPELLDDGLQGCSANALIGSGTVTAVLPVGSQIVTEKASLDALMGQPGKAIEILFYAQANAPVFAQLVLPSALQEGTPPYGEGLSTSLPPVQTWPEGPDLALETFDSTIGPLGLTYHDQVGGRTVSYKPLGMRIPQSCPAGGYPFSATLTFQDGTESTVGYRVPCPPH
jgi:hypothetical protein